MSIRTGVEALDLQVRVRSSEALEHSRDQSRLPHALLTKVRQKHQSKEVCVQRTTVVGAGTHRRTCNEEALPRSRHYPLSSSSTALFRQLIGSGLGSSVQVQRSELGRLFSGLTGTDY